MHLCYTCATLQIAYRTYVCLSLMLHLVRAHPRLRDQPRQQNAGETGATIALHGRRCSDDHTRYCLLLRQQHRCGGHVCRSVGMKLYYVRVPNSQPPTPTLNGHTTSTTPITPHYITPTATHDTLLIQYHTTPLAHSLTHSLTHSQRQCCSCWWPEPVLSASLVWHCRRHRM